MQSKLKLYSIPEKMLAALRTCRPVLLRGRVTEVTGTLITAQLPGVKVGELCKLYNSDTGESLDAEIIGFKQQQAILTPFGDTRGLSIYTEVCPTGTSHQVGVGRHLLGKVLVIGREIFKRETCDKCGSTWDKLDLSGTSQGD